MPDNLIAVLDGGGYHEQAVKNLIAGKGYQAVLPSPFPPNSYLAQDHDKFIQYRDEMLTEVDEACGPPPHRSRQCQMDVMPHFINYSIVPLEPKDFIRRLQKLLDYPPQNEQDYKERFPILYTSDPDLYEKLLKMGKEKTRELIENSIKVVKDPNFITNYRIFEDFSISIVVRSAGNDGNEPISPLSIRASRELGHVIVGALDANGDKSFFSQEDEEVAIMAPGHNVSTLAEEKKEVVESGTSLAAPLVTGSLAGFAWLSGYHPTAEEAKIILEKTAIPTRYSGDSPRRNGAGMLNAYKLGMLGDRLKSICGTDESCFKQKIREPTTYEFPEDEYLEEDIDRSFPECNQSCGGNVEASCENRVKVFERLRKAAFLNPSDLKLQSALACIYGTSGFQDAASSHEKTYRAAIQMDPNTPALGTCEQDGDCVLASNCEGKGFLSLSHEEADLHYATKCKKTSCGKGDACGCGSQVTQKKGRKSTLYSAKCFQGECSLKEETKLNPSQGGSLSQDPSNSFTQPNQMPAPSPAQTFSPLPAGGPKPSPSSSSAGQR